MIQQKDDVRFQDGAVVQAMLSIKEDVAEIKRSMVYRHEFDADKIATDRRISALEGSPAGVRDWLGIAIAGMGCLSTAVLGFLGIIVTIVLFYLSFHP